MQREYATPGNAGCQKGRIPLEPLLMRVRRRLTSCRIAGGVGGALTDLLAELPADARVPDAAGASVRHKQGVLNDEARLDQRAVGAVGETVAGGDSTGSQNQGLKKATA